MPANALLRSVSFVLDTASPACGAYAYGDLTRWNMATLRASGFDVVPTDNGPRPAASLGLPRIHELRSKAAKKNVGCACAPLERRACFVSPVCVRVWPGGKPGVLLVAILLAPQPMPCREAGRVRVGEVNCDALPISNMA